MARPQNLSSCVSAVITELFKSDEEARKMYRTAQIEDAFKEAAINVFKNAAPLVLEHVNAVYLFEEKGVKQLVLYADDSSVRSSLDARQGLLKIFLLKAGFPYDVTKVLISKREIKNRKPFTQVKVPPQMQSLRELTPAELQEAEEFASSIDDLGVREAFKKAYMADLQTL